MVYLPTRVSWLDLSPAPKAWGQTEAAGMMTPICPRVAYCLFSPTL